MFGFKRKKIYEFITREEANKISNDFINSEKYDKGTLELIKSIEKEIIKSSKNGFTSLRYEDFYIPFAFNERVLKNHFRDMGYYFKRFYIGDSICGEIHVNIVICWDERI